WSGHKFVLQIKVPQIEQFESFIRLIERITKHRVTLYNADIKPEQMFLYERRLQPFQWVYLDEKRIEPAKDCGSLALRDLTLEIFSSRPVSQHFDCLLQRIIFNGEEIKGREIDVLTEFMDRFNKLDPDVIITERGYALIPFLSSRLRKHNFTCAMNRFDHYGLKFKGGRSYWSYNQVRYQDYPCYLHGRFLVDTTTPVGSACDTDGIIEMVELSGMGFQQTAGRSFGAVFQSSLVRLMIQEGMIVAYKEKPIEPPISMFHMLKGDAGGLTIDPKIGFHQNVAELDFISMFPWLIYNHNISADTILCDEGPFEEVPDLPIETSLKEKGLIPRALKPFIDRRMHYKRNPSPENNRRAAGLKWVLVSCYGYLRYREFKLGIPTSHMAICAFARQTILQCMHMAEARGFEVIHAIVDCLYITKPCMTREDIESFRKELEDKIQIPIALEGVFQWIVFLNSRVDPSRALPATYFGVFDNGAVKVRGLEVRQKGVPPVVQAVQNEAIALMKGCTTFDQIQSRVPLACQYAREVLSHLSTIKPSLLVVLIKVSRTDYKHNIPQKIIVDKMQSRGVKVEPGHWIRYIHSQHGPVLVDEYGGQPDRKKYSTMVIRALAVLFAPFGFNLKEIRDLVLHQQQLEFVFDFSHPKDLLGHFQEQAGDAVNNPHLNAETEIFID
ncbi:MAG: hypothetical protein JNN05_07905, partial [Candidatus Omnitrophica bacterium]|nr:hypothetical protein [Candidatus Omnitrophota bacterium]